MSEFSSLRNPLPHEHSNPQTENWPTTAERADTKHKASIRFDNNSSLQRVLGQYDQHLPIIEEGFQVKLACRGNKVAISGKQQDVARAQSALLTLYNKSELGAQPDSAMVAAIVRMVSAAPPAEDGSLSDLPQPDAYLDNLPQIRTRRGEVAPRSPGQTDYMRRLQTGELVFGVGPAGTGKTYLAVAQGVAMLTAGKVERIILSRPAVEAGERLGFLPGDMREKIDPYLRPLYDALHDMLPADQVVRRLSSGEIEVAPLAFMRGRTLSHAFVILDEAQNTTCAQMKMFLTRLGHGTRMVVTGDLSQVDLPAGVKSGLRDAIETLNGVDGVHVIKLESRDVVRHPLVGRIVDAYDKAHPAQNYAQRHQPPS
ncbi:PhoH family protein [Candidatus Kirkpatrickella diaphorinae]|uniref:PhoH family protein n=1 Tax=Candidatus Kirkpatrickella diaphorinae TaxID=2984322 RepID=UPI0038CFCC11